MSSSSLPPDSLEFCSMEFWDYFVELECLQGGKGGKDLQLAAELGKTLLERNKELETGLKQQQSVIDDQGQEIEYLSKQSVALREVNDSRLRVYEQLEVSIQELEVTNQRLQDEAGQDKRRIRSLCQTVDCLETRAGDLQTMVEELRAAERQRRVAEASAAQEEGRGSPSRRRRASRSGAEELTERVSELERQLSECRDRERTERERSQRTEAELTTAREESSDLRQEMAALRERSVKLHTLAEEVHAMEEHRLSPFLRQCSPRAFSVSPQMAAASPQPGLATVAPPTLHSVWGDEVRWPVEDDSIPAAVATSPSPPPPPARAGGGASTASAPASLISDLDAHYRALLDQMDKYEWLLSSRQPRAASPEQPSSLSLLQELQMSYCETGVDGTAVGGIDGAAVVPLRDSGPDSLMMLGGGDGDTSSSGFSEGSAESRTVSRATQTPDLPAQSHLVVGQTCHLPVTPRKLTACRFQQTPQYKQLFQEIFEVLKKPVVVMPMARATSADPSSADPAPAAVLPSVAAVLPPINNPLPAVEERVVPAKASSCEAEVVVATASVVSDAPDVTTSSFSPVSSSSSAPLSSSSAAPDASSSPRPFSYTQEFERLKASDSGVSVDGAGDNAIDGATVEEEYPHLARPSEEVAKLRLLERSYAEALKAGRRCLNRPTLL